MFYIKRVFLTNPHRDFSTLRFALWGKVARGQAPFNSPSGATQFQSSLTIQFQISLAIQKLC
jgi:hypothetical protein